MTLSYTGTSQFRASTWKKRLGIVFLAFFVIGACVAIRYVGGGPEKAAAVTPQNKSASQSPIRIASNVQQRALSPVNSGKTNPTLSAKTSPLDLVKKPLPEIVADVNGQDITRDELAQQCLVHYGKEVLEHLVNKYLIVSECRRLNITVRGEEVDAEIERMATRFGIPVDQWLKLLQQERNVSPSQYANDIIWPTLALRKIAGEKLQVSKEELIREYEIQYGPAVKARLIACKDLEKAQKLHKMALADPEQFGNIAKDYSEDTPSAAAKGLIQPIRMHGTYQDLEKAAFGLADGGISNVIQAGGQYVILKREGLIPARDYKLEQVAGQLEEIIRERKLRKVANDIFRRLQDEAKVENVWNDPLKQQKMPGVAALINGEPIAIDDLALECIDRHGKEVLEGEINRTLLEVDCKKRGITVTEKEMEEEIARAASLAVKPKPDGSPDVDAWLKMVTQEQGITVDIYRYDAVWPSVALRKLAGEKVDISEEDLQKGFEANFGPKVRCLAIVLNSQRRAQEVFEKARKNNTSENFGDLAEQYSIEPSSNALRGEVPPIRKWGGQPLLEKEAFALKPGEISGVIQVGDKFVILRCEGFTKPVNVKLADVREEIFRDLYEKKLRLKMADYFEHLQQTATIHNYLAGTSQSPKQTSGAPKNLNLPSLKQVPAGKG
jgi:parvulin-like peptidyl-prolyl isomerase